MDELEEQIDRAMCEKSWVWSFILTILALVLGYAAGYLYYAEGVVPCTPCAEPILGPGEYCVVKNISDDEIIRVTDMNLCNQPSQ